MNIKQHFQISEYEAVVFDFDMTLADTSQVIVDLLNETAIHFGYKERPYEEILPVVGNTHTIMLSHVTGEKNSSRLLELQDYYRALCLEHMPSRTVLFPGAKKCIEKLARHGIQLGLVSLKLKKLLEISLKSNGIDSCIRYVIGGNDGVKPKPSPEGLIRISEMMNISPEQILYIGDSLVDEEAAYAAGADFCPMLLGGTKKEQFNNAFVKKFFTSWYDFHNYI